MQASKDLPHNHDTVASRDGATRYNERHGQEANCLIDQIIFLFFWPITTRETEIFDFSYLREQGFNVLVYDLSELLNKKALLNHPMTSSLSADFIYSIASYGELNIRIKEAASRSIFIDQLRGLSGIDLKTEKVFRILNKHDAKYVILSLGALPSRLPIKSAVSAAEMLLYKIRHASNLSKLSDYLLRKLIFLLSKYTQLYPLPYRIFGGNSDVLKAYTSKYGIDKNTIIPAHSLDYDTYLKYKRRSINTTGALNSTCVFIDDGITNHPDFALLKMKPFSEQNYFNSMNTLFEKIERETGLQIIIAAHPRSDYSGRPNAFGGRTIIVGETAQLIAHCSLVIIHASTAVSFAVLFNKPIIVVKTPDMIGNHFSVLIDTIAYALGLTAINIDSLHSVDSVPIDIMKQLGSRYSDYKYKYVKSDKVDDVTTAEIIVREIRNISREKAPL